MTDSDGVVMHCQVVEETVQLTLLQLCHACDADEAAVVELVRHGVLDPQAEASRDWRFAGDSLRRSRVALRLIRDLGVNPAGAALALELMARIEQLQARLETAHVDQAPAG